MGEIMNKKISILKYLLVLIMIIMVLGMFFMKNNITKEISVCKYDYSCSNIASFLNDDKVVIKLKTNDKYIKGIKVYFNTYGKKIDCGSIKYTVYLNEEKQEESHISLKRIRHGEPTLIMFNSEIGYCGNVKIKLKGRNICEEIGIFGKIMEDNEERELEYMSLINKAKILEDVCVAAIIESEGNVWCWDFMLIFSICISLFGTVNGVRRNK